MSREFGNGKDWGLQCMNKRLISPVVTKRAWKYKCIYVFYQQMEEDISIQCCKTSISPLDSLTNHGLVQDFGISIANAMEIPQSCTKPSIGVYVCVRTAAELTAQQAGRLASGWHQETVKGVADKVWRRQVTPQQAPLVSTDTQDRTGHFPLFCQ